MIDKQKFNDFFQCFDKEMIIEVIDLFEEQSPELIKVLAQNLEDHNLVQLKLNAHKLKGICLQLYDPDSSEHARRLEDTSRKHIIEIINKSLREFPEILNSLNQEFNESALCFEVVKAKTIQDFITRLTGALSAESAFKLHNAEKLSVADDLAKMLADLTKSADELLRELLDMKKEFTS